MKKKSAHMYCRKDLLQEVTHRKLQLFNCRRMRTEKSNGCFWYLGGEKLVGRPRC